MDSNTSSEANTKVSEVNKENSTTTDFYMGLLANQDKIKAEGLVALEAIADNDSTESDVASEVDNVSVGSSSSDTTKKTTN